MSSLNLGPRPRHVQLVARYALGYTLLGLVVVPGRWVTDPDHPWRFQVVAWAALSLLVLVVCSLFGIVAVLASGESPVWPWRGDW